jgi:hypothetical protein
MTGPVALETFRTNLTSVYELMTFDKFLLDTVIRQLERISQSQIAGKITNPRHRVDAALLSLRNIRDNESLRPHYQEMFNQCLVLLVSHFSSALRDLFVSAVARAIEEGAGKEILNEEIKLSVAELNAIDVPMCFYIAETLADKRDVSFQDMQSIGKAFRRYLDVLPERTVDTNNIILGQAARHVIVHAGGIVDDRMVHQVRGASPRTIRPTITANERLRFEPGEVRGVGDSMLTYLGALAASLQTYW